MVQLLQRRQSITKILYNIFVINSESKEAFIVDEGLSLTLAKKLSKKYSLTWSYEVGDKETSLKIVKGYLLSEKSELSYQQALRLFKQQIGEY